MHLIHNFVGCFVVPFPFPISLALPFCCYFWRLPFIVVACGVVIDSINFGKCAPTPQQRALLPDLLPDPLNLLLLATHTFQHDFYGTTFSEGKKHFSELCAQFPLNRRGENFPPQSPNTAYPIYIPIFRYMPWVILIGHKPSENLICIALFCGAFVPSNYCIGETVIT